MVVTHRRRWKLLAALALLLLTMLLAACGSASATASGSATTSTPTTTNACPKVTTGTIQSISSSGLSITNFQGKTVQGVFTNKTTIVRPDSLTSKDLKSGMLVSVTVIQNTNGTYSARAVNVRNSLTNQGGANRGSGICNGRRRQGNGTFGGPGFGSGTPGASGALNRQVINGTVSQINGSSLVVTDTSGNDFTMSLTSTTRITMQQTITSNDLHVGEAVMITGSANSKGIINVNSLSVLQGLPNRPTSPTTTPTTNV
jgi:hypothetical protein